MSYRCSKLIGCGRYLVVAFLSPTYLTVLFSRTDRVFQLGSIMVQWWPTVRKARWQCSRLERCLGIWHSLYRMRQSCILGSSKVQLLIWRTLWWYERANVVIQHAAIMESEGERERGMREGWGRVCVCVWCGWCSGIALADVIYACMWSGLMCECKW